MSESGEGFPKRFSKGFESLMSSEVLLENLLRDIGYGERILEEFDEDIALEVEEAEKEAETDRFALDNALKKKAVFDDLKERVREAREVHSALNKTLAEKEDDTSEKTGALATYKALQDALEGVRPYINSTTG